MSAQRLTEADLKAVTAALDEIGSELGQICGWLPECHLRGLLSDALGRITAAQWRTARMLGGIDAPDADAVPPRSFYAGLRPLTSGYHRLSSEGLYTLCRKRLHRRSAV